MSEFEALSSTIALTMGVAWASGINLYAAVLMLGIGSVTGNIALPEQLQVVSNPLVIGAAGLMYLVEFIADKTPGVDSGWDGIQTFIRIPAGALLASSSVGDVTPALEIAAGILGGGMAAASHATKAGARVMINTSPEPVTNWIASVTEDVAVVAGLWTALNHPVLFIGLLLLFILFMIWFLPKVWRGVKAVFRKIGEWFGVVEKVDGNIAGTGSSTPGSQPESIADTDPLGKIGQLKKLLDSGAITEQEYNQQKSGLLQQSLETTTVKLSK
ncbi:MAG: hypothetical protein CSB48_09985 [Proteobacteria bacterium]|nr:MAG: hypothetical protein CSB48_09985 [Pseudomonadota bacterium]